MWTEYRRLDREEQAWLAVDDDSIEEPELHMAEELHFLAFAPLRTRRDWSRRLLLIAHLCRHPEEYEDEIDLRAIRDATVGALVALRCKSPAFPRMVRKIAMALPADPDVRWCWLVVDVVEDMTEKMRPRSVSRFT